MVFDLRVPNLSKLWNSQEICADKLWTYIYIYLNCANKGYDKKRWRFDKLYDLGWGGGQKFVEKNEKIYKKWWRFYDFRENFRIKKWLRFYTYSFFSCVLLYIYSWRLSKIYFTSENLKTPIALNSKHAKIADWGQSWRYC